MIAVAVSKISRPARRQRRLVAGMLGGRPMGVASVGGGGNIGGGGRRESDKGRRVRGHP